MTKLTFEQRQELSRILELATDEDKLAEAISDLIVGTYSAEEWRNRANAAEFDLNELRSGSLCHQSDEGKMPTGDDAVIATHYVLVPYGMKCHKCGAPEPWKDSHRAKPRTGDKS